MVSCYFSWCWFTRTCWEEEVMNLTLFGNLWKWVSRLPGALLLSYSPALKSMFLTNRLLQDQPEWPLQLEVVQEADLIYLWELIFFCTNLQYLHVPQNLSHRELHCFFFVLKLTDWYMLIVMSLLHGDENCVSVQPLINFEKESVLHFSWSKCAFGSFCLFLQI